MFTIGKVSRHTIFSNAMLTLDRLKELKDVIKWHRVFCEAGLNPNTMRSAIHNGRELREEEAIAIEKTLSRRGIYVQFGDQGDLFEDQDGEGETRI